MRLPADQLDALRNLSAKQGGGVVGWISIAAARALTDLGFANRTQSGWQITPAGAAVLHLATPPGDDGGSVIPFQRPDRTGPPAP